MMSPFATVVRTGRCFLLAGAVVAAGVAGVTADDKKPADEKKPAEAKKPVAALSTPTPVTAPAVATRSLQECLSLSQAQQPNIRAAQVSLAASEAGARSLENLKPIASFFSRDLPVRKQQAATGLAVATADVAKALQENRYDVIRLYYTYIYAKQQDSTATNIIEQMDVYYDIAKELVKQGGNADLNTFTLFGMEDAISEVKKLRVTAHTGQSLSLAALKEAMGVDQNDAFVPRDTELPVMAANKSLTQDMVVSYATKLRPEMTMAAAGVDAFRLEVCAQGQVKYRKTVPTLAAGSDLHSRQVPMPVRNGEYRPGALAPEMPPTLAGNTADRVARAAEYAKRQEIVLDKTTQLVTLEAINSFHNWQSSTDKLKIAKGRFDKAQQMLSDSRANAQNIKKYDVLIRNEALGGRAQSEYLEAVFEHIKTLATLERVTAGGVTAQFPIK